MKIHFLIIIAFFLLVSSGCIKEKYSFPKEFFMKKDLLKNGYTKIFYDSNTKECLCVWEKMIYQGKDSIYQKVAFNSEKIYDSTYRLNDNVLNPLIIYLDTEYGKLAGKVKIVKSNESFYKKEEFSEINFDNKIIVNSHDQYTFIRQKNEEQILEIKYTKNVFKNLVDKNRDVYTQEIKDSIYFTKGEGITSV